MAEVSLLDQLLYSPLNWVLLVILLYLVYSTFLAPKPKPIVYIRPEPLPKREYTPKELAEFDGVDGKRIMMAVKGDVFDVSYGRNFYGPEGPYGNFAGRDASRGLGKGSFESSMLRDPNLEGLDDLADLDEEEVKALDEWHQHFNFKYYHAGWLVGSEAEKGKVPRDFGETKDGAGAGNKTD